MEDRRVVAVSVADGTLDVLSLFGWQLAQHRTTRQQPTQKPIRHSLTIYIDEYVACLLII